MTTAIQEEIFLEMGVGMFVLLQYISCLYFVALVPHFWYKKPVSSRSHFCVNPARLQAAATPWMPSLCVSVFDNACIPD